MIFRRPLLNALFMCHLKDPLKRGRLQNLTTLLKLFKHAKYLLEYLAQIYFYIIFHQVFYIAISKKLNYLLKLIRTMVKHLKL